MRMSQLLSDLWPYLLGALDLVVSGVASAHAIMYKRDNRSAVGWVGLIWLSPLLGALLYFSFGINRIRRRSRLLQVSQAWLSEQVYCHPEVELGPQSELGRHHPNLDGLAALIGNLTERPLLKGNAITPLLDGDEAFPAMLAAIDQAQQSIALCTYIFDTDRAGQAFLEALARAVKRGVEVRILIDDVGARYSRPTIIRRLRAAGVPTESFLPTRVPRLFHYANLRNHRKILVVDGQLGFTGGINIREGHWLAQQPQVPVQDIHFRVAGPVVSHLQQTFANDWAFANGECLEGPRWFPPLPPAGAVMARGIAHGPDEDFERLTLTIVGAVATANSTVHIVTPYFLPEATLIAALKVAAMRGVQVHVVLPEHSNIRVMQWATQAMLWQILERGCHVWRVPAPFDHSKLFLVDGVWSLFGSTNWDPRSLRLNFEFNVECYDLELAARLTRLVEQKIARARPVTFEEVESRSIPIRLRDGTARLWAPYL